MSRGFEITVEDSGESFLCLQDENLFRAMKRTGKGPIRYGCGSSGCGVCKIRIISGDYEIFKNMTRKDLTDEEIHEGFVLACCVKPTGPLTISKT